MTESLIHGASEVGLLELLLRRGGRRPAARAEVLDGEIRVHFRASPGPAHADFDLRWLRDQCDRDRRRRGRPWARVAREVPDRLEVEAAYVDAEDRLHVQWREEHGGRRVELLESVYELGWLRARAYAIEDA